MYRTFTEIKHMLAIWLKVRFTACLKVPFLNHFFIFDGNLYEQFDGVEMSFLGPTLANVFMCHFKNIWLENFPDHFKSIVYRRFIDDKNIKT